MKFLLTGDLHLTNQRPRNRIDDYEDTVLQKLIFIYETAVRNECSWILQPGDFFDNPSPSYSFFGKVIERLEHYQRRYNLGTLTVMGQHDLKFRNRDNTALDALSKASVVVNGQGLFVPYAQIYIHCVSWGEEIPAIKNPDAFNVLLIHKMIVNDKPLWDGQEGHEFARAFLRKHKFDLIVSGDNHKCFWDSWGDRYIFNLGSMMRSSIAQVDHQPHVVVFDTTFPRGYIEIPIPIKPAEEVFRIEEVQEEKKRDVELDAFVSGLTEHKEMGLSFQDNLRQYAADNNIAAEIMDIIKEGME